MSREPDIHSAEFVTFYKDRLLQQLDKAEQKHDEYVCDDTGLCDIQENLGELYIKLLHMDHLNIIIIDGKEGEPETRHYMNEEQIKRNKRLRTAVSAPAPQAWDL